MSGLFGIIKSPELTIIGVPHRQFHTMTSLIIHTFSVLAFTAVIADLYSLWLFFSLSDPTSHLPWNDEIYCKEHLQPGKFLSDI